MNIVVKVTRASFLILLLHLVLSLLLHLLVLLLPVLLLRLGVHVELAVLAQAAGEFSRAGDGFLNIQFINLFFKKKYKLSISYLIDDVHSVLSLELKGVFQAGRSECGVVG